MKKQEFGWGVQSRRLILKPGRADSYLRIFIALGMGRTWKIFWRINSFKFTLRQKSVLGRKQ